MRTWEDIGVRNEKLRGDKWRLDAGDKRFTIRLGSIDKIAFSFIGQPHFSI